MFAVYLSREGITAWAFEKTAVSAGTRSEVSAGWHRVNRLARCLDSVVQHVFNCPFNDPTDLYQLPYLFLRALQVQLPTSRARNVWNECLAPEAATTTTANSSITRLSAS